MMADSEYPTREQAREMLRACDNNPAKIKEWNEYRREHRKWVPDLSDESDPADLEGLALCYPDRSLRRDRLNLTGANLCGADLRETDLHNANLHGADLSAAKLTPTDLSGVLLWDANLSRADLGRAHLRGAHLSRANLSEANLSWADLSEADLEGTKLVKADLTLANLANADVSRVAYDPKTMRGLCRGIRVATCYGNALFRRDAMDQDYIDTLGNKLQSDAKRCREEFDSRKGLGLELRWRHVSASVNWALFQAWAWIDYGRSMLRTAWLASLLAFFFGLIFLVADWIGHPILMYQEGTPGTWLTPFYYSIVTYTTLGFGDVTPTTVLGQIVVIFEVIAGYLTLGLLVSILANKVARRS